MLWGCGGEGRKDGEWCGWGAGLQFGSLSKPWGRTGGFTAPDLMTLLSCTPEKAECEEHAECVYGSLSHPARLGTATLLEDAEIV